MSQTSPVYGNQFFKQVQNVAGTDVQTLRADNVKATNLQVTTTLQVPVQNTGPTGPAVAGQLTLLNFPAGTYKLYAFNGSGWSAAN